MNSSLATAFPNSVSVVLLLFKKLTTKYREPSTRQPLNLASFPVKNKKTQRAWAIKMIVYTRTWFSQGLLTTKVKMKDCQLHCIAHGTTYLRKVKMVAKHNYRPFLGWLVLATSRASTTLGSRSWCMLCRLAMCKSTKACPCWGRLGHYWSILWWPALLRTCSKWIQSFSNQCWLSR